MLNLSQKRETKLRQEIVPWQAVLLVPRRSNQKTQQPPTDWGLSKEATTNEHKLVSLIKYSGAGK